ncbi:hypothetical protein [Vagococcus fluvialis]|uniref:hypothetical protein n=1 Tax=Vagococcus fluvialis TaxID=2738 RepID=UPI003B58BD78
MNLEEYLLVSLMEECAEITQGAAKALRFGLDDCHPDRPNETNEQDILVEMYQLQMVFEKLIKENIITDLPENMKDIIKEKKIRKIEEYIEYAKEKGKIK